MNRPRMGFLLAFAFALGALWILRPESSQNVPREDLAATSGISTAARKRQMTQRALVGMELDCLKASPGQPSAAQRAYVDQLDEHFAQQYLLAVATDDAARCMTNALRLCESRFPGECVAP